MSGVLQIASSNRVNLHGGTEAEIVGTTTVQWIDGIQNGQQIVLHFTGNGVLATGGNIAAGYTASAGERVEF